MIISRRPPRLRIKPVSNKIDPKIKPTNVAIPVTATPANPAPTTAIPSDPTSALLTTSEAARPDSKNAEIGSAKTEAPNSRNPLPKARRILGAKKQSATHNTMRTIMMIGPDVPSSVAKAANAGESARAEPTPKMTPTMIRKMALRTDIVKLST
jgi:hypothetical protein